VKPVAVLGCGAFLNNRACLLDGGRVLWSAPHGDLGDARACAALQDSVEHLLAQADAPLQAVAHDLHPDFHSTHLAQVLAARLGVPAMAVQHHHAHIAVALAEHGVDGPVLGIALDGMGLGSDGSAWGGELLLLESAAHCRRLDHLAPLAQPGGDMAAREPWRLAAAVLHHAGRGAQIEPLFGACVGSDAARLLRTMLQRGLNCPPSSSAGRWFDAAAGALGLSTHQACAAEAAIALERAAAQWLAEHPGFEVESATLDLHALVLPLFALRGQGSEAVARGAATFHLGLAAALAQRAVAAAARHGVTRVVLAGGCFANHVLAQQLALRLRRAGLQVLQPHASGCGDEGLALGQAWVAAAMLQADQAIAAVEPVEA